MTTEGVDFEAQVRFSRRKPVEEIVAAMVADGFDPRASREAVDRLHQELVVNARKEGRASIEVGIALLGLGLLITIGTFIASARHGGFFFITGGLISGGLALIINGYVQRRDG